MHARRRKTWDRSHLGEKLPERVSGVEGAGTGELTLKRRSEQFALNSVRSHGRV